MTYFDHPQLFGPPPPPAPVPPRRPSRPTGLLTALVVLAVLALVGGIAVGRVTAPGSNDGSQAFIAPSGGFDFGQGAGRATNDPATNRIAGKVSPAVVNVDTMLRTGAAAGTGMIVTSNGDVLTNNHVINGSTAVSVELADGSRHSAHVVGYDVSDDVALIRMNGVSGLPTISTSTAALSVGDSVIALGNALGRGGSPTVVTGHVTGLHQTITASDDSGADAETLHDVIQTNTPIQPGDSGGPLVNRGGKVVGMDAAASTNRGFGFRQTSAAEGYAIPIARALAIGEQIARGKETATVHIGVRGIMGVALQSSASNDFGFGGGDGSSGAVVAAVDPGSPADHAGIQDGDTITSVAGDAIGSATALSNEMNRHHPGDHVIVTWIDGSGDRHHTRMTLEAGPPG